MIDASPVGATRLASHYELSLPLLFSLWIAGMDLACRRIPKYLTLMATVAGLGFQTGHRGLPGLLDGLAGTGLGFCLLLWPYLKGGMGAGDVKALAALEAWLGLGDILQLFIYMGLSGGLIIIMVLGWQGRLRDKIRQGLAHLVNRALCGSRAEVTASAAPQRLEIPYGPALALGMTVLCWRQLRL